MSEAERPNPASDLPTRFAAAVVMVAIACAAIYIGGWPFRLLVSIAAAVMLVEWTDMHGMNRRWGYVSAAFVTAYLLGASQWLFPAEEMDSAISLASFDPVWPALAVAGGLALLLGMASRRLSLAGGFLYVAIPSFALLVLDWMWFAFVLWVMTLTWATDIFAYFAGRAIGGPKLAPRISPKKTWAGLGGGIIGAAVVGALVAHAFDLGAPFLQVGGLMGLLAQGGDLYESWLKRRAGVKDSGTILPGHGGVLDRLDGLLPVVLAALGLLMFSLS